MAYTESGIAFLLSATVALAMSALVFFQNPGRRTYQVFASYLLTLFFLGFGLALSALELGGWTGEVVASTATSLGLWFRSLFILSLALLFMRPKSFWGHPALLWMLGAGFVVVMLMARDGFDYSFPANNPFAIFILVFMEVMPKVAAATLMVWAARNRDAMARTAVIVATCIMLPEIYIATRELLDDALGFLWVPDYSAGWTDTWTSGTTHWVRIAASAVFLVFFTRWTRHQIRPLRWLVLACMASAAFDAVFRYFLYNHNFTALGGYQTSLFPFAIWIGAPAIMLAYALLAGHVEGLGVRLRWTISKTSIAAIFIAVFFIVSEAAQQFFGDTLGSTYLGIAAAGALVFAIAPLSRMADRFANAAIPSKEMAEAERLYLQVLAKYRADDNLTPAEQLDLAKLANRLGIDGVRATELQLLES